MWRPPPNVYENPSLHNRANVFRDREDAGRVLAGLVRASIDKDALVMAIPAGGVPVAASFAAELSLDLSVLVVSKITFPWNPEAGYGAVAADGSYQVNKPLARQYRLDEKTIQDGIDTTSAKVKRRQELFSALIGVTTVNGRSIILVDDGLASGFTIRVAIAAIRKQGADEIFVAVPTGHSSSVTMIASECDRLYCANIREGLRFAVADAYEQWSDVSEQEVLDTLGDYKRS